MPICAAIWSWLRQAIVSWRTYYCIRAKGERYEARGMMHLAVWLGGTETALGVWICRASPLAS